MSFRELRVGAGTMLLGSTLLVALPATAQEAIRLDTVTVFSEQEEDYVVSESAGATKTGTPLVETPRSVDVVTREQMEDRAVTNLVEATNYTAGVTSNHYGFDPRFDQIYIRGFPAHIYGDFRDGLRQMNGVYGLFTTEPWGLERVEVIKGPVAVLYGQTTPGGIINSVSKSPKGYAINEVYAGYTDTGRGEVGFDFNRVLNESNTLQGRLVGLGRYGEASYDIQDDRYLLQPSVRWTPSESTSLTFFALAQHDETDASVTQLNRNGVILPLRSSDPDYDHQKHTQFQLGYALEHEFDNGITTLKQNARLGHFDLEARYLTGSVPGGGWLGGVYRRGAQAVAEKLWSAQADTQLVNEFSTGLLDHRVLAGIDLMWATSDFRFGESPADPHFALDPRNPVTGLDGPTPAYTSHEDVDFEQIGVYAQDQISFGNWRLSGGIRFDSSERSRFQQEEARLNERKDEAATYNIGLLYAFDNGISPYASWSTSFLPSTNIGPDGNILEPTEGEQFEVGVKYQPPGGRSYVAFALYDLTEENVAQYVGFDPVIGAFYEPVGEVHSRGFEAEGRWSSEFGLDVIASYAYNDAEIVEGSYPGNIPLLTPKHTTSLWLDYLFETGPVRGLSFGAGVRHVSETFGDSANTIDNDAYTMLDAAIRYDLGALDPELEGLRLAINARNLTDEKPVIYNNGYYYQAEGRTITASLRYRW